MLHQPLGGNRSLHGLAGLGGNPDSTIVAALPAFRPVSVVDVALRELIDREGLRPGRDNRDAGSCVSDVKLLQGDLSEAWREGSDEYASVAMRFALNDVMEDRSTGKPAPGSQGRTEATEVWTFRRPAGAGPQGWKLSAIQHAA